MSEIVYLAGGQGPPVEPTGLAGAIGAPQEVTLKWTASTTVPPAGTITYYLVKRSATPGTGYVTVSPALTTTTFTDSKADLSKPCHYIVTAFNTGGESNPSKEILVAPPLK